LRNHYSYFVLGVWLEVISRFSREQLLDSTFGERMKKALVYSESFCPFFSRALLLASLCLPPNNIVVMPDLNLRALNFSHYRTYF